VNKLAEVERVIERRSDQDREGMLICVAVSLFNYAEFLPACLDSVAAQNWDRIELIIVDDRSERDDSVAVAQEWIEAHVTRFERVLLLRHRTNQGLAQARNTAFSQTTADRVFVIDADNVIYPRCLSRLSEAMDESGYEACYSQLEFFGDQRQIGYADLWSPDFFERGNYVDAMALVSKAAWERVQGYSHIEGGWEDYDFWCKFVEHGFEGGFVPEILGRYRVHGQSMLRSETSSRYGAIYIEMSQRHPWLRLGALS